MPTGIYKRTDEYKRKMSQIMKKCAFSQKGKHWKLSEEVKQKLSEAHKGKKIKPSQGFQKGNNLWNNEKSKQTRFRKGQHSKTEFKKGEFSKEKHYNWQGGKSFEPYGLEFNEDLKEVIRNRDRRKCFICSKTELEKGMKLDIHHINYDKKNNNPNNLISLCRKCHIKTNYKRYYWIDYFKIYGWT